VPFPGTITSLGSLSDTNARSAHTCSIFRAPEPNTLVLAAVRVSDTGGTPVQPTGVVGAGLTFDLVGSSVTCSTVASPTINLSFWRGMGSAESSVITATLANASLGCGMIIHEVTGVPVGLNGANAVGQSATSVMDTSSQFTIIAPVALAVRNAWLAATSANSLEFPVPSGNYQVLDSVAYATPDHHLTSAWTTLSTGTIVDYSASGVDNRGGLIVELVAASDTAGGQWAQGMSGFQSRSFSPRVRGDLWVQPGDIRSTDPATDTWEDA
jgi:hypothetical protein